MGHTFGMKNEHQILLMDKNHNLMVFKYKLVSFWMWVIWTRACDVVCRVCGEGPTWHTRVNPQCRRGQPTSVWKVDGTRHLKLVVPVQSRVRDLDSNKAALNAALGKVRTGKHKGWQRRQNSKFQVVHCRARNDRAWRLQLWWPPWAQQTEIRVIASLSMPSGEQRQGGCHCSRCLGDQQWDDKGKMVDEGRAEIVQGERWWKTVSTPKIRPRIGAYQPALKENCKQPSGSRMATGGWLTRSRWSESCQGDSSGSELPQAGQSSNSQNSRDAK